MEPPFKRRRVGRVDFTDEELRHRRARNDLRLKSAFENIFEKYGKDFTGIGDEIDLATGEIVVNRGHLSSLDDEKNPGREEDLFDELDGGIWSDETRAATEQSHVKARISAFENSLSSGLGTEMRDSSQSSHSPNRLIGDAKTGLFARDTDELARLQQHKPFSNPRAPSPRDLTQAVENENSIEPKWRAPPLPDQVSTFEEKIQTENVHFPNACENRSMSPPGKSLWGPARRSRKPQLPRRTDTFIPLSKLSGLPLCPIKQTHVRRSTMSLSYEWSEISFDHASEQGSTDLPIMSPEASRSICKSVSNLPWTKYEDHKLYYLRSEAGVSDSQLAAAFPNRSKTEIEERWLSLHLNDKNSLVHNARHQKNRHTHSINTSNVADRRKNSSSTLCRPAGDQISPSVVETQPFRLSNADEQQISPVKPRFTEQTPSSDPKYHDGTSKVPKAATSIDLVIDLTLSDEDEAAKTADSGYLTESPEHSSKQSEISVSCTKGILKRVTRKSPLFNKFGGRSLIGGKRALAGDETEFLLYTEIPEVQNQILPGSMSQPAPSSKKPKRPRWGSASVKARQRKQLAVNRGSRWARNQKPLTPNNFVTPSAEISTEALPSSCVAIRSSRSPRILKANNINSNCRKDIPNINNVYAELRNREDSEDVDCLLEALPVRIITPAKVRPQKVSSAPSSASAHSKAMNTKSVPLRPRIIDDLSDDELATPVQNIRRPTLPKVISSPTTYS